MRPLTVAEIGAFLGITAGAVRVAIHRHQIPAIGKHGRAKTYDPAAVLRHTGAHDRRSA